ncbi:MAG: hypothetical protein M3Y44_02005 [Actinomycetota bacterium]|nr:hypothetical protein [Actinomycetota bacterium]
MAAIIVAMVLLLAGTIASFIYVHQDKSSSSATVQSVGGQRTGGTTGSAGRARATGTALRPSGTYPTPSNPAAAPTPPPLDMGAVQRTMEAYLNAVQNHDLPATRSIVCPKFRASYKGTYSPQGYAYSGWSAHYDGSVPGTNYAYVVVTQGLLDTSTGVKKGSETHSWYVERDAGSYYVCGYIA